MHATAFNEIAHERQVDIRFVCSTIIIISKNDAQHGSHLTICVEFVIRQCVINDIIRIIFSLSFSLSVCILLLLLFVRNERLAACERACVCCIE